MTQSNDTDRPLAEQFAERKAAQIEALPAAPALEFDWRAYDDFLDRSELSEDQRRELLETLWSIVVSFVDLGFGLHPIQRAVADIVEAGGFCAAEEPSLLHSAPSLPNKPFEKAAARSDECPAEGTES